MSTIQPGAKCWCGGRTALDRSSAGVAFQRCAESEFHQWDATGRREKHTKLYVAGPMTGYEEANYPAFNLAAERLEGAGYEVCNPATAVVGTEAHYVDFIREDLRMMLDCHGVAVIDNWWESSGARNEVSVAGILLMPVRTVAEWLERAHQELGA
jgi:hypothetical protein